jgi:hypothetical protein
MTSVARHQSLTLFEDLLLMFPSVHASWFAMLYRVTADWSFVDWLTSRFPTESTARTHRERPNDLRQE